MNDALIDARATIGVIRALADRIDFGELGTTVRPGELAESLRLACNSLALVADALEDVATLERVRRRDMFAAAALTGMIAKYGVAETARAVSEADELIAVLDKEPTP